MSQQETDTLRHGPVKMRMAAWKLAEPTPPQVLRRSEVGRRKERGRVSRTQKKPTSTLGGLNHDALQPVTEFGRSAWISVKNRRLTFQPVAPFTMEPVDTLAAREHTEPSGAEGNGSWGG